MTIITDLNFFDTVYLKNDPEQLARTIIDIEISPAENGNYTVIYQVMCVTTCSRHYRRELSKEKDEVKIVTS